MTTVYVQYHESWDGDCCSYEVLGVTQDPSHRWELETCWVKNAEAGTEVWVLWVEYESGDSLTQCSGQGEVIAVFTSELRAHAAHSLLEESKESDMFGFKDDGDEMMYIQNPASDHFSSITSIHVKKFSVGDCPPSKY